MGIRFDFDGKVSGRGPGSDLFYFYFLIDLTFDLSPGVMTLEHHLGVRKR